jgi:hypothetical protein
MYSIPEKRYLIPQTQYPGECFLVHPELRKVIRKYQEDHFHNLYNDANGNNDRKHHGNFFLSLFLSSFFLAGESWRRGFCAMFFGGSGVEATSW